MKITNLDTFLLVGEDDDAFCLNVYKYKHYDESGYDFSFLLDEDTRIYVRSEKELNKKEEDEIEDYIRTNINKLEIN